MVFSNVMAPWICDFGDLTHGYWDNDLLSGLKLKMEVLMPWDMVKIAFIYEFLD